ncbi:MAG: trigger factor [Patescibacteria group bacterium]
MTTAISRKEDHTIELTLTIPWPTIKAAYEDIVNHAIETVEVPGFRKGKAPRNIAEEKLDRSKIYEEVVKKVIPEVYNEAITKEKIRPIVNPQIELQDAKEEKDWVVKLTTCERPSITLGVYKKAIQDVKASVEKKIWTPGEEMKEEKKDEKPKVTLDMILKALYGEIRISLPAILLQQEVNRLLAELIDQTKKLGLTVEQYLASTQRNADSIKTEYEEQAKRTLSLEFALEEIADKEGIFVSDDDMETVLKTAKNDEERKALEKDIYYLSSILRRQKTLDFLSAL